MGATLDKERGEYTVECDLCRKERKVYELGDKRFNEFCKILDDDGWIYRSITKIANGVLFPDTVIVLCKSCSENKQSRAAFFKKVIRVHDKQAMAGFEDKSQG